MDILQEIVSALRSGESVAAATIIASSGSTPVPAGAKMIMKGKDRIPLGTIGGGCMEAEILEAARSLASEGRSSVLRRFALTEDDLESGMVCGGTVDVLLESIPREDADLYAAVLDHREAGERTVLISQLDKRGSISSKRCVVAPPCAGTPVQGNAGDFGPDDAALAASLAQTLQECVSKEDVRRFAAPFGELVLEPVPVVQDLFVFGGGHVSRFLCRCAALAGFRVTIVDDRIEYANAERFPEAWRTHAVWFDDAWDRLMITPSSSIVIVTRGHKYDEGVLLRAVKTNARYIGMIGSARKVAGIVSNLARHGIGGEDLRRVHAPIGLAIGAKAAEEIAVSIAAELVAVRRGVRNPSSMSLDLAGSLLSGGKRQ